jgi:hypothetical protein
MRTRILITIILSLSIPSIILSEAPVSASEAPKDHSKYHGVLEDKYYDLLARCETNSNWNHSTRTYTSGLGINRRTFQRWSNHTSAKGMTPRQQVKVADAIAFLGHTEPDGEYVWPVGPYGWSVVKYQNCMKLQGFICRSKHPKVQRWKRYC